MLALAGVGGPVASASRDWSEFRGPNSGGVARLSKPPVKLGPSSRAWKTPVPPGLSSPVVSHNRIFLTAVEQDRLVTLAFDSATGRIVWQRLAPAGSMEKVHQVNSPATPTPCADNKRVYVYFGSYGLLCYDHAGRPQWQKPIPTPKSLYGAASSPILHGDNLILVLDNDANLPDSKLSQSRILALKKSTGEVVWEAARPLMRSGWSTPTIWRHAAGEDLVVLGSGRVCGYNPRTGAEKWFATGFSRETIAQPVFGNGHVYVSSAMLGGVADEQPDPEPFWHAMLQFDANGDGRLEPGEMTEQFTFPFRPELPLGHPGFGMPLADDAAKRKEQQAGLFASVDKNKDGFWTREEFLANMSFRREKPRLVAIAPGGHGNVTDTHVTWQLNRSIPEIPTPLFHQDRLYLIRNGGVLTAVNANDGKILYDERLGSAGQYSASPVVAHDHLYLLSNLGVISVVKPGDAFQLVHQYDLREPAYVTPAFDATSLYVRTESHLWAFRANNARGDAD